MLDMEFVKHIEDTEILIVYNMTDEAIEILGADQYNPHPFDDNGAPPDGPAWYIPLGEISDEVVDQIEDHRFAPPPVEKLLQPFADRANVRFGTHVCRNCDARFSCAAYRVYMRQGRGRADQAFEQYYSDLEMGEPLEEWRTSGLDSTGNVEDLL